MKTEDHPFKSKLYEIIFGVDTPEGKTFDIILLWIILLSVLAVILESVAHIQYQYGEILRALEWGFTILFTAEYILRLYCSPKPENYASRARHYKIH